MDIHEIRHAFSAFESLPERIRQFRADRISRILARDSPVVMPQCPKTVLHLLPISGLDSRGLLDISRLPEAHDICSKLSPMVSNGGDSRFNFDGFVTSAATSQEDPSCYSYLQLFRNGSLETVEGLLLREYRDNKDNLRRNISGVGWEKYVIQAATRYLSAFRDLDLQPPIVLLVSLLGVKGYTIALGPDYVRRRVHTIDRDDLLLPDVVVERFDDDAAAVLRPVFDALWQAAGFPRSLNYDESGIWKEK